jgi:peptidoglycan L-alanyl-D-glutamate endopeptidase CwlK
MQLHPAIRHIVVEGINAIESVHLAPNICIRVTRGWATASEQNTLFAQGRTAPGRIVTNSRAFQSFHNYGLAFDFVLMYDRDGNGTYETVSWDTKIDFDKNGKGDWMCVVSDFKALGFVWGGDFRGIADSPHFERTFGFTWQQLKKRHDAKMFIPGTQFINLTR